MKNKLNWSVVLFAAIAATACVKKKDATSGKLLEIQESGGQDLSAEAGTPEALCSMLSSGGYFPSNKYATGTEVAFSTSYGIGGEAGQAYGSIDSDGYFNQRENTTGQGLVAPGLALMQGQGKSLWQMSGENGYAELAKRVVCNTAGSYGNKSKLHPGYQSMRVSKLTFSANTAGRSYSYGDSIKVELKGGPSTALIYFAKGAGLVATEFRETTTPDGTAKVYIGASGSTSSSSNREQ